MKIKILHILHSLQVGGLENGVVNLINRLDPERFDHAICCITSAGPMAERLARPVEIHCLGKGSGRDYLLPLKIARVVGKVRPDIVHTRNWGTIDGIIGARLAGVGRIVHGEHGREAADPTGANGRRMMARKAFSPLVSRFVAVSADLREWLVDGVGIPGRKVVQIINGVDADRFSPPVSKTQARSKLGLASDGFVVGTVGRLDPVKDFQTLLRGFARMAGGCADTLRPRLVIAGSGPEEARLRALAEELGMAAVVAFLGERGDIPEVMRALDVFVLPSIAEGISNTVLEAMASGLPVVATGVGGNLELVEDGETGFLFAPGDAERLAERLGFLGSSPDLTVRCGGKGRVAVEERFSLARMVAEYGNLYSSVREGR